jgi:Rhodopirellula transposase DDE domain
MESSLPGNAKTIAGSAHPDRNAPFEQSNAQTQRCWEQGGPVISVATQKKEILGNFSNDGQEWPPKAAPEKTLMHDFADEEWGKAVAYEVYDVGHHQGWGSVGIAHDPAEFATASILSWWQPRGCKVYPKATELLMMADAGGSHSNRSRLGKVGMQR